MVVLGISAVVCLGALKGAFFLGSGSRYGCKTLLRFCYAGVVLGIVAGSCWGLWPGVVLGSVLLLVVLGTCVGVIFAGGRFGCGSRWRQVLEVCVVLS